MKAKDSEGNTALHIASKNENVDEGIIKCLFEMKSDANIENIHSQSPFFFISHNPNLNFKIIKLFYENGADLNSKTSLFLSKLN